MRNWYIAIVAILLLVLSENLYGQRSSRNSVKLATLLPASVDRTGSTDYTHIIQNAMDRYDTVYFPAYPLRVNRKGLSVKDNQELIFPKGSKLLLEPTSLPSYEIIRIKDVRNVRLNAPYIIGDRKQHRGNSGEWGMGISILGSSGVQIINPVILDCWGDGIYIGETVNQHYSSDVMIIGALCSNNRRNGISIISASNLVIRNSQFNNTNGTMPMSGIAIEPNHSGNILKNIRMENVRTNNNKKWGIEICLDKMELMNKNFKVHNLTTPVSVIIKNHRDVGSESSLFLMTNSGGNAKASRSIKFRKGSINIVNPDWTPRKDPVNVENYASMGPEVLIQFSGTKAASRNRNAVKVKGLTNIHIQ